MGMHALVYRVAHRRPWAVVAEQIVLDGVVPVLRAAVPSALEVDAGGCSRCGPSLRRWQSLLQIRPNFMCLGGARQGWSCSMIDGCEIFR